MLTAEQIATAKTTCKYEYPSEVLHEHDDCVRLAYEWLDAQKTISSPNRKFRPLKHIVEKWAGRYISQSDVELAAHLHPRIFGKYPDFNLSARLTLPADRRLEGIGEALTQGYRERMNERTYSSVER